VVKTLVNNQVERGIYNLTWDGKDDNNRSVAEGIYFYTLETDPLRRSGSEASKQNFTKKLVMTR
jgi:flagellar hook assembly protein FlgD